jgi:CBS-domain-containing membrane protein
MNGPIKHLTVADLMTEKVVSIAGATPFKEIVALIREHRVSALPVVDESGRVVGIVSEADLLLKEEQGELGERRLLESSRRHAERRKAAALTAAHLMTAPAVTIKPTATVAAAATLMHGQKVKRLPVVDEEGRLVGIVSRSDLLKVFLRRDEEIEREVLHDLALLVLWLEPSKLNVKSRGGVVTLAGEVPRLTDARFLAKLALELDGVVGVVDELTYRIDDTRPAPIVEAPRGMIGRPFIKG